jgi:acyl-CoA oxidase
MGQLNRLALLSREHNDREKLREVAEVAIIYAESLAFKFGVHDSLFRNVINMLGSKEQQKEWIPLVDTSHILGSFAMVKKKQKQKQSKN